MQCWDLGGERQRQDGPGAQGPENQQHRTVRQKWDRCCPSKVDPQQSCDWHSCVVVSAFIYLCERGCTHSLHIWNLRYAHVGMLDLFARDLSFSKSEYHVPFFFLTHNSQVCRCLYFFFWNVLYQKEICIISFQSFDISYKGNMKNLFSLKGIYALLWDCPLMWIQCSCRYIFQLHHL